jgi:hypothetical protein
MAATGLVPAVLLAPPRDPWIRKQRPLALYLDDLSAKDIKYICVSGSLCAQVIVSQLGPIASQLGLLEQSARARPGRVIVLSVSPSESIFYGGVVWARIAQAGGVLNS